ncbi:hypothetical protein HU200_011745 [Digitaria exilis]|uniref:Uncharacterized protein n=1 Tax=Digitaria exilis TaxID=1010633 RepID=A0A835FFS6_9POAL|nr:hypothetical protein HU200_011745 [Digitaria exilis]
MASRYDLADAHRAYAASLTATGAALHDFLRALQDAAPPPPDAPGEEEGDGADDVTVSPPVVSSLPPDASEEEDNDDDNDDDVDDDDGRIPSPSDEDEASDVGGGDDVEAEPSLPRPPEHLQPVSPAPPTPQAAAPQAPLQMVPSYVPGYPAPPPYSYGPTAYGYGSSYGGGYGYGGADMAGYYGHTVYNNYISYARSHPPPPYIVHHHQVADVTAGYYHDDDHQYQQGEAVQTPSSSSQYGAYYYSYPYPYMHAGDDGGSSPVPPASAQLSAPRPTTPSPPRSPTTWAFLDPFEGIEAYYQGQDHPAAAAATAAYAPSQTSSDVNLVNEENLPEVDDEDIHKVEDDGLPDLEDDESGVVVGDDARRQAEGERTCSCKTSTASEDDSDCNDPAEEGHIVEINTLDGVEGENDSTLFLTWDLCFRFMKMWHTMSECHHMQCHVFSHAKNYLDVASATFSEDLIYLIKKLEHQLLDMAKHFSGWFNVQKKYATFLNEWLRTGIEYEPEVTDDGVAPFSPRRLGAPPIFSIYNNWAISIGRISDAEVVGTLQALAFNVQSILGEMAGISSFATVVEAPLVEDSLQSCMTRVFGAMESFAVASKNAYEQGSLHSG